MLFTLTPIRSVCPAVCSCNDVDGLAPSAAALTTQPRLRHVCGTFQSQPAVHKYAGRPWLVLVPDTRFRCPEPRSLALQDTSCALNAASSKRMRSPVQVAVATPTGTLSPRSTTSLNDSERLDRLCSCLIRSCNELIGTVKCF